MPSTFLIWILFILFLSPPRSFGEFSFRVENYFSSRQNSLEDTNLDQSNRILNRPNVVIQNDFRPELKFSYDEQKIVVRPRWIYSFDEIKFQDNSDSLTRSFGKSDLTDAYFEAVFTDELRTTIGLQVYQWGPAEFLNASNPIFHLNSQQRSTLFKEKGKVLLRLNADYSKNLNQVLIHEPISNQDPLWIADEPFRSKSLIKTEWVDDSNVNTVGFVFGKEERGLGFFGEYFSFSPAEGLSVYLDSKHTENSTAFYPSENIFGSKSLNYDPNSKLGWTSFGVVGFRNEWSNLDLRLEYIYNSSGWSTEQFKDIKSALYQNNPETIQNFIRFSRPGLELLGRSYSYLSLRFFNLGRKDNHSIALRYLHSNTDSSGNLVSTYDWDFNDSINFFGELNGSFGDKETELNLLPQKSLLVGFRWSL